ncbi:MAG: GAF domain-containing sensor histidine kinase [Candidatus Limnocylindrales bacterium]|jgi:signal transduction histidine kinase
MYPRRRWAVVFGAILLVGVVEALSDSLLDAVLPFPLDTILVLGAVAAVAIVAAWYAFRLIDRLTSDLIHRHQALKSRNAALRAVYKVSLAVSGQADPDETLAAIAGHARRLLRVDAALVAVQGPEDEVRLRAASAAPGVLLEDASAAPGKPPGASTGASSGVPGSDLARYLAPGYSIRLEAPVGHGETRVGSIGLATAAPRRFSDADVETLSALATQVGLALEAARLRDELRVLAVQGERERIAREMHDGMAQVLGYVNTKSQAVEELLAAGRVAEAGRQMAELAEAARSLYVDVREAILSLSPPVLPERGLAAALEEYAARFAESSKLAVRFHATSEASSVALPAEVGAEMLGVAREALTNIRKHAYAQRVTIGLAVEEAEVLLRVADDGVGFDSEKAGSQPEKWPHFGLAGMRERAEAVGGRIAWRSRPGSGSIIELRVPVAPGRNERGLGPSGPPDAADDRAAGHQAVQSSVPTHSEAD